MKANFVVLLQHKSMSATCLMKCLMKKDLNAHNNNMNKELEVPDKFKVILYKRASLDKLGHF